MSTGLVVEGDHGTLAQGVDNELLVLQLHGAFYQAAKSGRLWQAHTAVTGVSHGTAIGTTAAIALANPRGSGVNLVVAEARMGYVSGTLGAGVISYCAHKDPAQAAISGTAITAVGGPLSATGAKGTAYTTATVPSGGTPFRVFGSVSASLATTAMAPWVLSDYPQGQVVVDPGCAISLQATAGAGGSTPLVVFSLSWEEIPVE